MVICRHLLEQAVHHPFNAHTANASSLESTISLAMSEAIPETSHTHVAFVARNSGEPIWLSDTQPSTRGRARSRDLSVHSRALAGEYLKPVERVRHLS